MVFTLKLTLIGRHACSISYNQYSDPEINNPFSKQILLMSINGPILKISINTASQYNIIGYVQCELVRKASHEDHQDFSREAIVIHSYNIYIGTKGTASATSKDQYDSYADPKCQRSLWLSQRCHSISRLCR